MSALNRRDTGQITRRTRRAPWAAYPRLAVVLVSVAMAMAVAGCTTAPGRAGGTPTPVAADGAAPSRAAETATPRAGPASTRVPPIVAPIAAATQGPPSDPDDSEVAELRRRTARAEDLSWLAAAAGPHPWLPPGLSRSQVIRSKQQARADGDADAEAEAAGVLAAEAQARAARVLDRWVGRIDPKAGLLPRGLDAEDRVWDYANTAADLYPHLVIAAHLLRPAATPALLRVLAAERALTPSGQLPRTVPLAPSDTPEESLDDLIYGAVEFQKDGLLPLMERLGGEPWLGRMRELARAIDAAAPVRTRFGQIPSERSEVNGQALQVLSRLYWATGDDAYRASAERIARAYLELALPDTDWLPTRSWDFKRDRSSTPVLQLRDHGNEVVAGLVEYHLIETVRGDPSAPEHRVRVRAMLDRLLDVGRTPEGLWRSEIDLKTGKSRSYPLSDNWGYLYAAYLAQAMIEEGWPGGDAAVAERYREAARAGLDAASRLEAYPWQGTEQDGYADAIESALYLLNRTDVPEASAWTDRQAGTLFGAQDGDGRVEDAYLDGNFIRTALLYAAWQGRGVRAEPWEPGTMLGAATDGGCLAVAVATGRAWRGRVIFDTPRHREHLGLPADYPRLNAWPEWWAAEPGRRYAVTLPDGSVRQSSGEDLAAGLPLALGPSSASRLLVCTL
jgi:hypothetical protein